MNKRTKENFKEGSYGFHELLDRTGLITDTFEKFVIEHTSLYVAKNKKIKTKAHKILTLLWDLYQEIGESHLK